MCLLILGWKRLIIWNRIWLRPRMLSGEPNRSCWRSPKPHTLYGDIHFFVLSVMLVQYDKPYSIQINNLHYYSVNVKTLPPFTLTLAHSSLLHSSCSSGPPWSTRLPLRFCAPRLQGLWHEKVVHGDREGEVSRHTRPGCFLKPGLLLADVLVLMQAGVHGEEQTSAGPAEGAEDGDRVFEAGGAAAAAGRALQSTWWRQGIHPGARLHTSQQCMITFL